jgi:hypothetical protein
MDLENRRRADLAFRYLNGYLENTGDYQGLGVLPYYLAYRALVRSKVEGISMEQEGLDEEEMAETHKRFKGYLSLAENYTEPRKPVLIITHGVSGSGKTTGTQPLIEGRGMIRIRMDVERKRLFGHIMASFDISTATLDSAQLMV